MKRWIAKPKSINVVAVIKRKAKPRREIGVQDRERYR